MSMKYNKYVDMNSFLVCSNYYLQIQSNFLFWHVKLHVLIKELLRFKVFIAILMVAIVERHLIVHSFSISYERIASINTETIIIVLFL